MSTVVLFARTSIGFATDPEGCRAALFETGADFALTRAGAKGIFDEVIEATNAWREIAVGNGVPERELRQFRGALDRFR